MVGIEAAIVLIAFVIIASALAYVVINMGFFSAQKAKETIARGVEESTSALQLDGSVIGRTNGTRVQFLTFPVKLSVGKSEVDLNNRTIVVSVWNSKNLLDVYKGVADEEAESLPEDPSNLTQVQAALFGEIWDESAAYFIIYNDDNDTVLENFEKAFLVINLGAEGFWLPEYNKVKIEVRTGSGAALTVERMIPGGLPVDDFLDLG